ncbi:MAG TPA: glycosyltransferase family 2 protein [Thermomicrobiales bacterium]
MVEEREQGMATGATGVRFRVAAVIPALNEAPAIGRTVAGLRALDGVALDRIIVVDNGSTDDTAAQARAAGAEVVREDRRGYGQACLAGVLAADDVDLILLLDGDAADDPTDIPRVLAPLLHGEVDLVVGSRTLGSREAGAMTPQQIIGNALVARIMWWRYGIRVTDLGPLRAIRRADLLALAPRELTYGWSVEMMVKAALAGYRFREVPVSYRRRIGVSKVGGTLQGSVRAGWCILATVLRHRNWRALPTATRALEGR